MRNAGNQGAACLIIKYDIYANNQELLEQIIALIQAADDENLEAALKIESQPELVLDYLRSITQEQILERLGLPVVTIISAIALSLIPELVPAFIVTGLVIAATFPGFRKAIDELIEHRQFSANLLERLFEKSSISLNVILDFGFWILDWRFTNERIKV